MHSALPTARSLAPSGARHGAPAKLCPVLCQATGGGFFDGIKKLGKQVQGSLPIVGLISRLTSPEGGFGEQSYPEYARTWWEVGNEQLNFACTDLEAKYGRVGSRRAVFLILWMVRKGLGLLKPEYFVLAARRLRASMDIEAEMIRYETYMEDECRNYDFLERPSSTAEEQLAVAVDALATCCFGLRDGEEIPAEDQRFLLDILSVIYGSETSEDDLRRIIKNRKDRKYAKSYL